MSCWFVWPCCFPTLTTNNVKQRHLISATDASRDFATLRLCETLRISSYTCHACYGSTENCYRRNYRNHQECQPTEEETKTCGYVYGLGEPGGLGGLLPGAFNPLTIFSTFAVDPLTLSCVHKGHPRTSVHQWYHSKAARKQVQGPVGPLRRLAACFSQCSVLQRGRQSNCKRCCYTQGSFPFHFSVPNTVFDSMWHRAYSRRNGRNGPLSYLYRQAPSPRNLPRRRTSLRRRQQHLWPRLRLHLHLPLHLSSEHPNLNFPMLP